MDRAVLLSESLQCIQEDHFDAVADMLDRYLQDEKPQDRTLAAEVKLLAKLIEYKTELNQFNYVYQAI